MSQPLSEKDFSKLASVIQAQLGIQMPASKRTMLSARIQKRLRILNIPTIHDYVEWVIDPQKAGQEYVNFLDIVTTNKTDFFREPVHFDYLTQQIFPAAVERGSGVRRPFKLWSAGCSSGEEPYTLAIVAKEFERSLGRPFQLQILATDISSRVLKKAKNGVYEMERISPISQELRKRYLLRHKDPQKSLCRMGPELRQMIRFDRLNFMDESFNIREPMDVIFCRNVMIYFDRETQQRLVQQFCRHLQPGGYIFIGHSESLNGLNVPVEQVAPTIYQLGR
uniref:Chemotaxis protein methyltransferase n=1 Tax=Magnetococcus massalia (strain MO-1) TaxID=451514 RepID=A0A1S7LLJ0_MAGMO|nr:Chemotaxis protein methyltransferase [Candidatus Magnetococcus massalia]